MIVFLLSLLFTPSANAFEVRIISPAELASQTDWKVVDARPEDLFLAGHLPSAQRMDWQEWTEEKPNFLNSLFGSPANWGKAISDSAVLQQRLSRAGLSHEDKIVVVGQPKGWGEEGRIAWNLLYWGAERVALLDGGYPAWEKRFPARVEKGPGHVLPPGNFRVSLKSDRRATLAELKDSLGKRTLLDSRTEAEFAGEKLAGQKRGGRIPGAKLVPALKLYRDDGQYVTKDELSALVPTLRTATTAYCTGGVRSALLALLMEVRLGERVANYDGSIWEWSRQAELVMEK